MKNGRQKKALYWFGILPALWLALLCAPFFFGGLANIIEGLPAAIAKPFQITIMEDTGRCVLLFLVGYGIFVAVHASSQKTTVAVRNTAAPNGATPARLGGSTPQKVYRKTKY